MARPIYALGQVVYLKVNATEGGLVTGILERPGSYLYAVTWADHEETYHYPIELTPDKDFTS